MVVYLPLLPYFPFGKPSMRPASMRIRLAGSRFATIVLMTAFGVALPCGPRLLMASNAEPVTSRSGQWNFQNDIEPILGKFGCNSSACHGKAEGQNGFQLTVFGFDPQADFFQIAKDGFGHRIAAVAPEKSLLLLKATSAIAHGGGARLTRDQPEYIALRDWIAAGAPWGDADDPQIVSIDVLPEQSQLSIHSSLPLRVEANWSDGRRTDVTRLALFQSNRPSFAKVSEEGVVTAGSLPGVAAVMASYLGQVDLFQAIIPRGDVTGGHSTQPAKNESLGDDNLDRLIERRLALLNIQSSPAASDATFIRRAYLDIIGTLPTAAEAREHLADQRPDRRARLVDQLLQRPEYADYWALKWSDLLRVNRQALGHQQAYEYYRWIRQSFAQNKPLDELARNIVTAKGPVKEVPEAHFYHAVSQPDQMASTVSQVFLGVRIECAQCHHHPYDRWGQKDYFGMQAFFTQVSFQSSAIGEAIVSNGTATTTHPRTGAEIFAHALSQPLPEQSPQGDRRELFADWLTSPDNDWFARNLANRLWAHFMGRGLVEPVDDFRSTNPPSNPELLAALASALIESRFDQHELIRIITASAAYQRSGDVNATNQDDEWNYSRYPFKRMEAEVLLDAVSQVTGIWDKFEGVAHGTRAVQLWDSNVSHPFLVLFGRPVRATVCSCERVGQPTVSQVLHLLNSPELQKKLSHQQGYLASLVLGTQDDVALLQELYLTLYCRLPETEEQQFGSDYLSQAPNRRQAAEDLVWGMMNSLEFAFNH